MSIPATSLSGAWNGITASGWGSPGFRVPEQATEPLHRVLSLFIAVRITLQNSLNVFAPRPVLEHCDTFRTITAGRNDRSPALFVGGIEGSSKNRTRLPRSWCQPNSLSNR